MNILFGVNAQF